MHFSNSFVTLAALAAAPIASAQGPAVAKFIEHGQSLVSRHISILARQSLASLPTCAQPAIEKGITSTTCSLTDYACICKSEGFVDGVTTQLKSACSADDQAKTLSFANQVCASAGAPLDASAASDAAPAASPAASPVASPAPASDAKSDADAASPAAAMPSGDADASSAAPESVPSVAPPYPAGNASSSVNGTNATTPFMGTANELKSTSVATMMSLAGLGLLVIGVL